MGQTETPTDAELLRRKAISLRDEARVVMACSLAIEDGEMDAGGANELIAHEKNPSKLTVQSEHYPGDDYFDRADRRLQL